MTPRVVVYGRPGACGGANTELSDTLALWQRQGVEARLREDRETPSPPAIAVGFCDDAFLRDGPELHRRGVHTVWVPCMCRMNDREIRHYQQDRPFDAYVFQSRHQQAVYLRLLVEQHVTPPRIRVIHGAFDVAKFPFQPLHHQAGEPFVVGRLSRPDPAKFSADMWETLGRIRRVQARVMGWSGYAAAKCGRPPAWAETLGKEAEACDVFLQSLHAMIQCGDCDENWPRTGLEAMASGVPVIVPNRGGWVEMIRHGETGFLCDTPQDASRWANRLADDEPWRLEIAQRARQELATLADPEEIGESWRELFGVLA